MTFRIGEPDDKINLIMLPTKKIKVFVNGKPATQKDLEALQSKGMSNDPKIKVIRKRKNIGEIDLITQ